MESPATSQRTPTELGHKDLVGDPHLSRLLAIVAGVVLLLTPLINSPGAFSQKHQDDKSLLHPIVNLLGLFGAFPTARGVEIRNVIFYSGAVLLSAAAGIFLIFTRARPRHSLDDMTDFRERAKNPYFWWIALLVTSLISSWYSHAPDVCLGQTIIRCLQFAWWLPLAIFLQPRDVRLLCKTLVASLLICSLLGLWYHGSRSGDFWHARLQYPLGNELWMAACILPLVPLSVGLMRTQRTISTWQRPATIALLITAAIIGVLIIYLTRSRSSAMGLAAAAFTLAVLLVPRRIRPFVLLVAVVLAIVAALAAQQLRTSGVMGQRAHSIRSRLNFEWPYAIKLFTDKPVAGNGDGAYSMLAGQYARLDQLEDPSVMRFDEKSWTGHAHNEFLELLSDLGLVGTISFAFALALTFLYSARYCDKYRLLDGMEAHRWLVAGLAGALAGLCIDICTEPSIREPGLPPIFFAIWAMLWAMVRRERLIKFEMREENRLPNYLLRCLGAAILVGSMYLGWKSLVDWSAARAKYQAQQALESQNTEVAIHEADRAARGSLDPFQRNQARLLSIWARSIAFDNALASAKGPLTKDQLSIARDGLVELNALKNDVPRFLKLSRLDADLSLNAARESQRRRDLPSAAEFNRRFLAALEQSRADEPFSAERVMALWQAKPNATVIEHIGWLRALIRGGEFDAQSVESLKQLMSSQQFQVAMNDLVIIARQDAAKSADKWRDTLSPETLRVAALSESLVGRHANAVRDAELAEQMYSAAGPRLFAAHSAVLLEIVTYDLQASGGANTKQNLERLARSYSIFEHPVGPDDALPGKWGQLRLKVLEAAGLTQQADAQKKLLGNESR